MLPEGVIDAEKFGHMHLRQFASLPEFVQGHAGTIFAARRERC